MNIPLAALRHFRKMRNRFPSIFPFSGKKRAKTPEKTRKRFRTFSFSLFFPVWHPLTRFSALLFVFLPFFFAFGSPMPSSVSLRSTGFFLFFKTLLCFSFYFLFCFFLYAPLKLTKFQSLAVVQCLRTSLLFLLFPPPFCFLPQFFYFSSPLYFRLALVFLLFGPKYAGIPPAQNLSV